MIKRLLSCVREYKITSIMAPILVSGEVVMEVIIPLLMASLIDNGIDKGDISFIYSMGGLIVICTILSLVFGVSAGAVAAKASSGFAKNLRHDIFYSVQNFSFSNIDKFSTSGIVTRLTTDVSHIQMAYQMVIRIAVRAPVMAIFSLIMAFRVNARLALIFLAVMPILLFGLIEIAKHAHPIFEKVFHLYDRLNEVVEENLRGIRVVKSFVREEHEIEKFEDTSEDIYNNFSKAEKLLSFNAPLMQTCSYSCMILIAWFGARLIVNHSMTTGQLMSMMTYAMQILMSLMMISMIFVMITISRASAVRINELLTEKSTITNKSDAITFVPTGDIEFKRVSFSYTEKGKESLKGISFKIPQGKTVGIIGGTGSGKTTLVSLIPRLFDVKEGEIKVGGLNIKDYNLTTLRDSVAVVLQKNVLFSGTVSENLRWGNENATEEEMIHACKIAQAHEFIMAHPEGYDRVLEQGATNVSGGQKQRICIARALLKKPRILILDDSTSAVDTATEAKIRKALKNEMPETTKFIIAQRISSIMDSDIIIVLDEGKINAIGTHSELLKTNKIYKEVYNSQQKKGGND